MPTAAVVFITRRPEFTPAAFKTHMEETHMPMFREVLGDLFPTDYTRRYVERVDSGIGERLGLPRCTDPTAPVVVIGTSEDIGWDMMGEMVFRDELHMQQVFAIVNADVGVKLRDDEEKFILDMKVVMIGSMTKG